MNKIFWGFFGPEMFPPQWGLKKKGKEKKKNYFGSPFFFLHIFFLILDPRFPQFFLGFGGGVSR